MLNRHIELEKPDVSDKSHSYWSSWFIHIKFVSPDENATIVALKRAVKRHNSHLDGLLFHSDMCVQCTSSWFVKLLKENKIDKSISGKGNC